MAGIGLDASVVNARAVAASGGPPLVKDLAQRTARRLLALGVNLNFAPVLDIHSNAASHCHAETDAVRALAAPAGAAGAAQFLLPRLQRGL